MNPSSPSSPAPSLVNVSGFSVWFVGPSSLLGAWVRHAIHRRMRRGKGGCVSDGRKGAHTRNDPRVRYWPVLDVPAWRKVATCTPPRQRVRRRSDGAHLSIIILPIRRSRARMRVPTSQLSPLLLRSVQLYSQVGPAPARRVRGGLSEGLSRFRTRKHLAKHARDDRAGRLASCFLI